MTDLDTENVRTRTQELFLRNLRLLEEGRLEEWLDLYHPDSVLEFPFLPQGWPAELEGRAAIAEHMKHFPEQLRVSFRDVTFVETADPTVVVAEFTSEATALVTGRDFRQSYLSIVWTEDGLIKRYRDFWNPLVIVEALGGTEAAAGAVTD
ncbi:phenazine biosynthesis protein [Streptomyces griseocarneus]|nr:phenazine biosynthesis protein [Streptomyces griseocarneus]